MSEKTHNRTTLVAAVASATGQSQSAVNSVLEEFFKEVADTVKSGGKVTVPGWLSASRLQRAARTGRNPQTGETIQIPAGNSVKLAPGSKLKAAVK